MNRFGGFRSTFFAAVVWMATMLWPMAAAAQVSLVTAAGSSAGRGGGTRTVIYQSGYYFAFYYDGLRIRYRSSNTGVGFFAAADATPASQGNLGFSVANLGDRVVLAWGTQPSGTTTQLWYREGTISGGTITWKSALGQLISSHLTELRGYFPVVELSGTGIPVVDAYHFGETYQGPLTGCGATNTYRPSPHLAVNTFGSDAGFLNVGYCNEHATAREPSSLAMTRVGATRFVVHSAIVNGLLVTGALDTSVDSGAAELGETSQVDNATVVDGGQLCSIVDNSVLGDVHHVYLTDGGAIGYVRQDASQFSGTNIGYDRAIVSSSGSWPYIAQSRPGGCHTIAWAQGNNVRTSRFQVAVDGGAGLTSPATAFANLGPPTQLGGLASGGGAPAVTWQQGTSVVFGVLPSGADPTLTAQPTNAPADNTTPVALTAGPFLDSCGATLPQGEYATFLTSIGTFAEADQDVATSGLQLPTDGGYAWATLRSGIAGQAYVVALPIAGGRAAQAYVQFDGIPAQLAFSTPPRQVVAGQCSQVLTVELRSDAGIAAPTYADRTISLSGGALQLYGSAGCGGPLISSVTVPAGRTDAGFYATSTVAGVTPVTASSTAMTSAAQDVTVVPDVPATLQLLTGPFSVDAGSCSPAVRFRLYDQYSNLAPQQAAFAVTASTNSATAQLFLDSTCSTAASTLVVAQQDAGSAVYFSSAAEEMFDLQLSASGVPMVSQTETVVKGNATVSLQFDAGTWSPGDVVSIHATVTNAGSAALTNASVRFTVQGLSLSGPGWSFVGAVPPSFMADAFETGVITGAAGTDVVVRAHVEGGSGVTISPEVEVRHPVASLVTDLGSGCLGCSAGGEPALVAFALLALSRRRRR